MKTFYTFTSALLLCVSISAAAYADSGFGLGFTGDSPAALTAIDSVVEPAIDGMDAAAAAISEIEPAAGDEATDVMAPATDAEINTVPETMTEESIDNVIIKSIHQE